MTRFSYGARLDSSQRRSCSFGTSAETVGWIDEDHCTCVCLFNSRCRVRGVTYPATSRVISLTKAVLLERKPFLREIRVAGVLGVTSVVTISTGLVVAVEYFSLEGNTYGGRRWGQR